MKRAPFVVALLALIAAFDAASADPTRTPCQADDAIPEFVTRRIELVSAVPVGDPRGVLAVDLERDAPCRRGSRTEP